MRGSKMSRKITSCCVALLLALTSVFGAQRKLDSIRDEQLPSDILMLLRWFANKVNIDYNNVISLPFNPNSDHHCSHHFGNFEGLLEPLHRGFSYYTVGNRNHPSFPTYVATEYAGQNTARIIFSSREYNGWRVERVYITRHRQGTNEYDPRHTYEVSTRFLRGIRNLSIDDIRRNAASSGFGLYTNTSRAIQRICDCLIILFIVVMAIVLVLVASSQHVNK